MAIVTITEAAELAGVSRGTLYNRLQSGALSRSGDGIDTSELLRVFGPLKASEHVQAAIAETPTTVTPDVSEQPRVTASDVTEPPEQPVDARLTAVLTAQLEAVERERTWLRELVDAERARVADKEQELAARDRQIAALTERVVALLPAPEPTPPPRRGLWHRVFG